LSGPAPVLPADLTAGLRRLKLGAMRQLAPEVLLTAKTQRWAPEEVLRTLIEAEIASRDASNTRARLKAAAFPVIKTIQEFDLAASSIPAPTWDYLTSLEWIGAKENLAMIGPAGTGKSHTLIALGHAAAQAGHRVRYFTAPDLVETLYRGLADNSVGKTIDTLLRNDLLILDEVGFAPLDDTGTQLLFRLVAAAYERRALAIASHWSFEDWRRSAPTSASERRDFWESVGVTTDSVSSTCLTRGLGVLDGWAAALRYQLAADSGDPIHVRWWDLRRGLEMAPGQEVFVCENPRVLGAIAERGLGGITVVCTSGRSTLVVLEVLRRLSGSGAHIGYHGDFDWPGIAMTNQLIAMFEVQPWSMSADDYLDSPARLPLVGSEVAPAWDADLGAAMRHRGLAVHEEAVLGGLLDSLWP
jgi:DNA replication protein DnaC